MNNQSEKILVLGGARSGKSLYSERWVQEKAALQWIYIATAQAFDQEMEERIAEHQSRRDQKWQNIEAPLALAETLKAHNEPGKVVLLDCLTLWLSNVMLAEKAVEPAIDQLLEAIQSFPGSMVIVSNEVGLGIVPDNALARRFRDAQGRLNQKVASIVDRVYLIAAGLPLQLK